MKKILLTGAYKYSQSQLNSLKGIGYHIEFYQDERKPLDIDVSNIDAVVCNSLFLYNDIKAFKNLKFIQLTSVGLDRVPLDYIKEKGIQLFNAKGAYSIPIAEWVVLKILEIYKCSKTFYKRQDERKWKKNRRLMEISGKTAAIIGFGDIGSEIAKRLRAFNVHIIGVGKKHVKSELLDQYYLSTDIDIALSKSDIIILTLPLTNETIHLINEDRINKMKDGCVLINVSRGEIIDEIKMIKALQEKKFLGVALDVFEKEPLSNDSLLWTITDLIITPHNSFVSDGNNERLWNIIFNNTSKFKEDFND